MAALLALAAPVAALITNMDGGYANPEGAAESPTFSRPARVADAWLYEPTIEVAPDGAIVVAGARAAPGPGAWRSTDDGRSWSALGAPSTAGATSGRPDLAMAADGTLYVADFAAASPVVARYVDGALAGWTPLGHAGAALERPWIAVGAPSPAFDSTGGHELFVSSFDAAPRGVALLRSPDAAVAPATERVPLAAIGNLAGPAPPVAIDPVSGAAYAALAENGRLVIAVVPQGSPVAYKFPIATLSTAARGHASTAVDEAGNVYVAWSAPSGGATWDVFVASSLDGGRSWSAPLKMSDGGANVRPAISARQPGRIVVAWYGSDALASPDSNAGPWRVHFAQSVDALDARPTRVHAVLRDVTLEGRGLCMERCPATAEGTRALGDFLGVAIAPDGYARIAYAKLEGDETRVYYVAQTGGTPS